MKKRVAHFRDTPEKDAIRAAMLNSKELANLAGLRLTTVRAVLSGRHRPRAETRRKLAAALRAHSETLATLADQLEPPT